MASYVPAKKNTALIFYISLEDQANPGLFKVSPTLAAGDVKVATDDGAPANIATLPVVDADFTKRVKVSMSAGEMNGDNVTVIFSDAAGAEWFDLTINIQTATLQIDDLATPTNITAGTIATVTNVTTVNGLAANVITATSIAADAITAAKIAAGAIDNATFAADVGSTAYATNIIALAADKAIQNYGALKPTTAGRTLDVTATGAAGVDWGNVENPTTTVGLSGTTISVATNVVSVATGAITSNSFAAAAITSSAFGTGAITAGVIAADAIGASELAADAVAEIQSGLASAIATVDTVVDAIKAKTDYLPSATAGAAGGVFIAGSNAATSITTALTANIIGNVSGSIGSLGATAKTDVNTEVDTALADIHLDHLLAVDYDPAAKPGTATALLNELIESDGGVSRYTANALEQAPSGTGASAATIADAVWDEVLSGHLTAGSTGEALNAAGAAGDPWTTALPGAYGAGSAGKIIGDNINAPIATVDTVVDAIKAKTDNLPTDPADQSAVEAAITAATSPLATAANLAIIDDFLDTEIAAIKAKTDNLPTDPADQSAVEAAITAATSPLATAANLAIIDDFLDTEIAAIKAKTDNLPGSPAAVGSAMTLATGAVSADALAADAVDEILDEIVEGSTTLRQAMRALLSLAAGKSSRSGSTIYLRDIGDTKNRVALTHDSNADRTAVTMDLT